MENEGIMKRSIGIFSEKADLIQAIILGILAFLVPTFLAKLVTTLFGSTSIIATNSQLIVGSIVNMILVLAAINIKGWAKIIAIVTMPSISTIMSGYVFQSASPFMVFMIPAIWLGNFALIYAFKFIMLKHNLHYFLAGAIGIIVKVAIIFGFFNILALAGVFPEKVLGIFKVAMGTTQLITASIGVVLTYIIYFFEKKQVKE